MNLAPRAPLPCYLVNNVTKDSYEQCKFVVDNDCLEDSAIIDYVYLVYCDFGYELRHMAVLLIASLVIVLFLALSAVADEFLCPSLLAVAKNLRMSDSLAGVTLLAFGNGCPDIFASLAAASDDRSELIVGELLGAGIFCTSIVSGLIFIHSDFKLACRPVLRDSIFYLFAVYLVWACCWNQRITYYWSLAFIVIYVIYLIVALSGQAIHSRLQGNYAISDQQNADDRGSIGEKASKEDWFSWREESMRRRQELSREKHKFGDTTASTGGSPATRVQVQYNNGVTSIHLNSSPASSPHTPPSSPQPPTLPSPVHQQRAHHQPVRVETPHQPHYHHSLPSAKLATIVLAPVVGGGGYINGAFIANGADELMAMDNSRPSITTKQQHNRQQQPTTTSQRQHQQQLERTSSQPKARQMSAASQTSVITTATTKCDELTTLTNEWDDFLAHINPIDTDAWRQAGWGAKLAGCIRAPLLFATLLTVPVVDADKELNNWCRLLNSLHCITVPLFLVLATNLGQNENLSLFGVPLPCLVLVPGALVACLVLRTSSARERPTYHAAFAYAGFLMSILWIYMLATEIIGLLKTVGIIFSMTDTAIGLGILAWGNSLGDIVANISLAEAGYPRMALGASIGAPLLNLLLGFGLSFTLSLRPGGFSEIQYSPTITLLCSTLAIILLLLMLSTLAPPEKSKKPFGYLLIGGYGVYFALAVCLEYGLIKF